MKALLPLLGMVAVAVIAGVLGLWTEWWVILFAVEFTLLVIALEALEQGLPFKFHKPYQRALAWLFPVLLLASWQWLATSGIINPRWFPPPTRIAEALWQLTVTFD
ncbi:MAG TPA: hypothetical protein VFN03_02135, partial [Trueperaceae bacterium]|nr:hypothetical protein [Trueperaceae bacterium]